MQEHSLPNTIDLKNLQIYLKEEDIIEAFDFMNDRILFIFSILRKYQNKANSNKLKDILDII